MSEPDILDSREAGGKVVRGGAMRTAAYVGGLLLGLASTPFVVRHLGVVDFGRYATVSSLIFIVTAVTEGGLAALGMREYATLEAGARARLIRSLLGLRVVLTIVATVLAVGFALVAGYTDAMVGGTLLLCGGLLVTSFWHTLNVPLQTGLRLGWISAIEFARQFLMTAFMLALVVAGASLLPFFVAAPASALVALALTVRVVPKGVPLLPGRPSREWLELLRQTFLYAAATALGVLYFQLAMILTSLAANEVETGYFGVSFRIMELVNGVPWLLTTSAFPLVARAAANDAARLRYALQRMFEVALIAGGWFALVIAFGAPFAIDVVAGDDFAPSVTALQILGPAALGTFLIAIWAYALIALHAYRGLLISNAIAVVVMGTLTPILASAHGAEGAAIAALATEAVLAVAYAITLMARRPELRVGLRVLPRALAAGALAAGAALALDAHSAIEAAAATVVYVGALFAMRAVPDEVLDAFRGRGDAA